MKRNEDINWSVVASDRNAIRNAARGIVAVRPNFPFFEFCGRYCPIFLRKGQRLIEGGPRWVRFIFGHSQRSHYLGRSHFVSDGNALEVARRFSSRRTCEKASADEQGSNVLHGSNPLAPPSWTPPTAASRADLKRRLRRSTRRTAGYC